VVVALRSLLAVPLLVLVLVSPARAGPLSDAVAPVATAVAGSGLPGAGLVAGDLADEARAGDAIVADPGAFAGSPAPLGGSDIRTATLTVFDGPVVPDGPWGSPMVTLVSVTSQGGQECAEVVQGAPGQGADPAYSSCTRCLAPDVCAALPPLVHYEAGNPVWLLAHADAAHLRVTLRYSYDCAQFQEPDVLITAGIPTYLYTPVGFGGDGLSWYGADGALGLALHADKTPAVLTIEASDKDGTLHTSQVAVPGAGQLVAWALLQSAGPGNSPDRICP